MMDTFFPNPAEHASILIEICNGDMAEARSLARVNQDFADDAAEFKYWQTIEAVLTPEAACQAN
jgi:hypothetical protein